MGWHKENGAYGSYCAQRDNAVRRGIQWNFEFSEWVAWWGDDFSRRGRNAGQLQMGRRNDLGPYSASNCYKIEKADNTREWHARAAAGIALLHSESRSDSLFVVGLLGFGL